MAFILGYANQVDDAPVSGGSWNASYPLTNIKTRYLYQRARSTSALASASTMVIDTGENHHWRGGVDSHEPDNECHGADSGL